MADTKIKMTELPLRGAQLLEAFEAADNRGKFTKYFEDDLFRKLKFQMHESFASSNHENVVRGLHFQNPDAQARIVWCPYGKIWDVIVDLRKSSPTYKKWHAEELSDANKRGLYIPKGFAHGFLS
ncbi:MAG: dTDP-4-dehydrorhamnose 3,5-epimerase family protein, partial [Candidatus Micrarchaeia archaeon]